MLIHKCRFEISPQTLSFNQFAVAEPHISKFWCKHGEEVWGETSTFIYQDCSHVEWQMCPTPPLLSTSPACLWKHWPREGHKGSQE